MSVDATRWAWMASPSKSSELLVLLSMADRAGDDHTCWPSIARIVKDTKLNEKTVNTALKGLIEQDLIVDTGRRMGGTGRVKVYQLVGVQGRDELQERPVNTKKKVKNNKPEIGGIKNDDKSNTPKNGILPFLPCNTPEIGGTKYPQYRGSEPITLEPNKEPNNILGSPPANATKKQSTNCPYPNDFSVDQSMVDWLNEKRITAPWQLETEKFANHHIAKGSMFKDWRAAWRTWMLNSMKYQIHARPPPSTAKSNREAVQDAIHDVHDTDW